MPTTETIGVIDPHVQNPVYETAYSGKWHWDYTKPLPRLREWWKLKHHVVDRVGLQKGSRVLEIACGQGYHVNALRRMGYRVTGVDISEAAIDFALRHFPRDDFRCVDAAKPLPFPDGSFDLVWSHGAGFFHYDITDQATEHIVRSHLKLVRPGGHYLMMVSSNLSGDRPGPTQPKWAFEWQHRKEDVVSMLGRHPHRHVSVGWFPVRRFLIGPKVSGYVVGAIER